MALSDEEKRQVQDELLDMMKEGLVTITVVNGESMVEFTAKGREWAGMPPKEDDSK